MPSNKLWPNEKGVRISKKKKYEERNKHAGLTLLTPPEPAGYTGWNFFTDWIIQPNLPKNNKSDQTHFTISIQFSMLVTDKDIYKMYITWLWQLIKT